MYLAFSLNQTTNIINNTAAINHATTALELSGEAVARTVVGVRNSLSLMARLPVMRTLKQTGRLVSGMRAIEKDLRLLLDSYEHTIAEVISQANKTHNNLLYYSELPMALYRRLTIGIGLSHDPDGEDEDLSFVDHAPPALEQMRRQTGLTREIIEKIAVLAYKLSDNLRSTSRFIDVLAISNVVTAEDIPAIESLFATGLNDDLLKALVLKNLHGGVIVQVGAGIADSLSRDNRDCRAIINGSPFFCGPTTYDKTGKRSVWWVAVPVRNEHRVPIACLTALIDLGFLNNLATKFKDDMGFSMIFTDHRHIIIGNSKLQLVAEQVSLNVPPTHAAVKNMPWRILNGPDGRYLQMVKNLNSGDYRFLPQWKIFIKAQLQQSGRPGQFILPLCVILLAAAGLYVLSYGIVRIFIIMNGEY